MASLSRQPTACPAARTNNNTPPISDDFPDGYKMLAWVQMKDFILESTDPKFYGFVAQSACTRIST